MTPNVVHIRAAGRWLIDGKLHLALVQTPPPSLDAARHGAAQPLTLAYLNELLGPRAGGVDGEPRLLAPVPTGRPVVIALPELAFGLPDWDGIDALVRASTRPLILTAGFGWVRGNELSSWLAASTDGSRDGIWTASKADRLDPESVYNGAWVWTHLPEQATTCIATLKNFPHLRHEELLPNWRRHGDILRLDFDDLTLFPLICADIICREEGSPLHRIRRSLADVRSANPALLLGMLWESGCHKPQWTDALGRALGTGGVDLAVIVNNATDACAFDEEADKWRSLTGAFQAEYFKQPEVPDRAARYVAHGAAVFGNVVRRTEAAAYVGHLAVGFRPDPTTHLHLFKSTRVIPLGEAGAVLSADEECGMAHELARFCRRICSIELAGFSATASRLVDDGLSSLRQYLKRLCGERCARLINALLFGVEKPRVELNEDSLFCAKDELSRGLRAIGALCQGQALTLESEKRMVGQFAHRDGHRVLIWVDGEAWESEMVTALDRWSLQGREHPPLLVYGQPKHGSAGRKRLGLSPTPTDITVPRQEATGYHDITEPRRCQVEWRALTELEDLLGPGTREETVATKLDEACLWCP